MTENACFFLGTCPPPKFEVSSLSHLNLEPKIHRDSKNANICCNPKKGLEVHVYNKTDHKPQGTGKNVDKKRGQKTIQETREKFYYY